MKKKPTVHLPLQFFAEPSESTPTDGSTPLTGSDGIDTKLTASQRLDELLKNDKELQAEVDRRNTKGQETAVAREKEKWDAQAKAEQEEAARLAKMNAEEKAKHEREKHEKAIAEREAAVTKRELMAEASAQLAEKGLPVGLSACLDYTNADTCKNSMEVITKAFNEAVDGRVNDRLRGNAPLSGNGGTEQPINSLKDAIIYEFKNN